MDSNEHNKVIAFDTLFCTNHIQMMKVLLPYMDHKAQKSMAIYIKLLELNYTIEYFKRNPYSLYGCAERETSPDFFQVCSELLPFCTEREKKQLEQIQNLFQSMELYKEMSKTMDMMKDFMPDISSFIGNASATDEESDSCEGSGSSDRSDSSSGAGAGGFDIMNMLMNMLTPEQKQFYKMFGGEQNAE